MEQNFIIEKLTSLQNHVYLLTFGLAVVAVACFYIYKMVRKQGKDFELKKKNDSDNNQIIIAQLKAVEHNLSRQITELKNDLDKTTITLEHAHELEKQRISSKVEELSTTFEKFTDLFNKMIGEDYNTKKK